LVDALIKKCQINGKKCKVAPHSAVHWQYSPFMSTF
jgi:hypothetical protein